MCVVGAVDPGRCRVVGEEEEVDNLDLTRELLLAGLMVGGREGGREGGRDG